MAVLCIKFRFFLYELNLHFVLVTLSDNAYDNLYITDDNVICILKWYVYIFRRYVKTIYE